MSTSTDQTLQALGSFIKMDVGGKPFLQGYKCSQCGEVMLEHRRGCPNCAALGSLNACRLSDTGRLFTYTIVHRSFPGIVTPFISAVVKLDGGGFIKGNLVGVKPEPAAIEFDMPVRVEFDNVDVGGTMVLRYVFVPVKPQGGPA